MPANAEHEKRAPGEAGSGSDSSVQAGEEGLAGPSRSVVDWGLTALDLQLLQTASLFDLSNKEGRKGSNAALAALFLRLHGILLPDVIFEIGAREATFSRRARRHAPEARIYAFEANPHNYEKFSNDAAVKEAHVEYLHMAVSNAPGEVSFFIQKSREGKPVSPLAGSHSTLERAGNVDQERISVPATSVAAFVKDNELSGVFSAWIDVEGAIEKVLAGMAGTLDDFAMILCEVEERPHWKEQWLWPDVLGFLTDRGFVPVARDFEFTTQHNVIFLRRDAFAAPDVRHMLARHYAALGRTAAQP
jgi:FkbM family methyltransferase